MVSRGYSFVFALLAASVAAEEAGVCLLQKNPGHVQRPTHATAKEVLGDVHSLLERHQEIGDRSRHGGRVGALTKAARGTVGKAISRMRENSESLIAAQGSGAVHAALLQLGAGAGELRSGLDRLQAAAAAAEVLGSVHSLLDRHKALSDRLDKGGLRISKAAEEAHNAVGKALTRLRQSSESTWMNVAAAAGSRAAMHGALLQLSEPAKDLKSSLDELEATADAAEAPQDDAKEADDEDAKEIAASQKEEAEDAQEADGNEEKEKDEKDGKEQEKEQGEEKEDDDEDQGESKKKRAVASQKEDEEDTNEDNDETAEKKPAAASQKETGNEEGEEEQGENEEKDEERDDKARSPEVAQSKEKLATLELHEAGTQDEDEGEDADEEDAKKLASLEREIESLSASVAFLAKTANVDADKMKELGLLEQSEEAQDEDSEEESEEQTEDAPEVSQDPMANGFPKKVAPKHDVDHDAMGMKGTKMSVKGLPEESSYVNHKTQTADWRNEYKWSTESPSELERSGAARALPLVVALTAVLARCVF